MVVSVSDRVRIAMRNLYIELTESISSKVRSILSKVESLYSVHKVYGFKEALDIVKAYLLGGKVTIRSCVLENPSSYECCLDLKASYERINYSKGG